MVDCVKDGHWFTHHPLANGLGLILLLAVSAHPSLPLCRSLPSLSVPSLMSSLCQCYRLRNKDNQVLLKYSVTILIMTQLLLQHGTHTTVGAMLHGADSRRKQLGSHSLTLSPGRVWHGHRGARGAVAPAAPWRRAHGLPSSRRLGPAPGVLPLVWPPHHGHGVLLGHRLYRPAVERQNKDEKMLFFFFCEFRYITAKAWNIWKMEFISWREINKSNKKVFNGRPPSKAIANHLTSFSQACLVD